MNIWLWYKMKAANPCCSDKVETSGGNLSFNINKKFQIDHVSIGLETEDIAIIEEKLPVLNSLLQFAHRETVHAESGSWNNLFMGHSNGYVEIGKNRPTHQVHFSIAFRSISKGALDLFRAVLDKQEIPYVSGMERITKGNESLDWFRFIEFTDSVGPVPFFFIEYTDEYLEETSQAQDRIDQFGRTGISDTPSGITSIDIFLDGSVFDLFSEINHWKQTTGKLVEDKQVIHFGESSELIIRRSTSSRLVEIRLPGTGQLKNSIKTNGGWKIGTEGNALVIRNCEEREYENNGRHYRCTASATIHAE